MNKLEININDEKYPLSLEDAKQMAESIKAFDEGKEQPKGRFVILEQLK